MDADRPPTLLGWVLPKPRNIVWATVLTSIGSYFLFDGQATANTVAILGAVLLTITLFKRDTLDKAD